MGMKRVLFRDGEPYMAGIPTYPETYSADRPAWCWEDEPGVWVIRYAGEHADTICEYGTENDEAHARRVVDMLNGRTDGMRTQLTKANRAADKLTKEARSRLDDTAQGVLL